MYKQSNSVITRQIAGDTLLIPITQVGVDLQKVYLLNETAAAIWELLQTPRSADDLVTSLQETYEAPEETIRRGVEAVLEDLTGRGFITLVATDG
ncbi:MAG: PqqD family protein [Armatimonadota bacterium]